MTDTAQPQPAQKKTTEVGIAKAKGRPMLTWVGKKPLGRVTAYPAQHIERFLLPSPAGGGAGAARDLAGVFGRPSRLAGSSIREGATPANTADWSTWPATYEHGGLLFHGDNKDVLAHLLANGFRGQVKLIYIDPPFDSGADYVRRVQLRGPKGTLKIDGEDYALGEQVQYTDIWSNDTYLQFMYERLLMAKELLVEDGMFVLHCDPARGHYLKCILDEVFGPDSFINQVVWKRSDAHSDAGQGAQHFGTVHDMIYFYGKSTTYTWNTLYTALPKSTIEHWYRNVEPETGRRYNKADVTGPGGAVKGNPVYEWKGITRAWRYSKERMADMDAQGLLVYTASGMPYQKRYLDESKGVPIQDWWDDIQMVRGIQRRGESHYPTEKPEAALARILSVTTNPGDLVLDCFIGSGTTAAVAQKLGRRWIGCDINKGAIQTTAKRLQGVMREQAARLADARQGELDISPSPAGGGIGEREPGSLDATVAPSPRPLPGGEGEKQPCQLSFGTWRVNDYDLQIQHNEAVELVGEHLGISRTRTDPFFDGTRGSQLVKIVPLNHPLSPLDCEALRLELKNRPEEERDILLVCLGIEHAARDWIELHNRNHPINKLHVVELRTDRKAGGVIRHEPLSAQVSLRREDDKLVVEIQDVLSPSILQRLHLQEGLFRAEVADWRAVVDCVLIDTAYTGEVFNVALADVPERKQDLVQGRYELPVPPIGATVAVKIIDMLGEELLIQQAF